ncbi:MAG: hypothetical protein AB7E46_14445 [Desulfovibrio sp.]|nr:hypothetical protein [Pseudomonadota bacterium]
MKIRMNILTLSLALVAVLGLAGMANAQGYMMGGPGMNGSAYSQPMGYGGGYGGGYGWGCGGWGW